MFHIQLDQCIDAVLIEIKSDGSRSLRRVAEARLRNDGALQLLLASSFDDNELRAEKLTATLMARHWTMEQFHHIYHFKRVDDPHFKPREVVTTAYVLSPRP